MLCLFVRLLQTLPVLFGRWTQRLKKKRHAAHASTETISELNTNQLAAYLRRAKFRHMAGDTAVCVGGEQMVGVGTHALTERP